MDSAQTQRITPTRRKHAPSSTQQTHDAEHEEKYSQSVSAQQTFSPASSHSHAHPQLIHAKDSLDNASILSVTPLLDRILESQFSVIRRPNAALPIYPIVLRRYYG